MATSVPFITACPTRVTISGLTDTPYFNDTTTIETIGHAIPTDLSHWDRLCLFHRHKHNRAQNAKILTEVSEKHSVWA